MKSLRYISLGLLLICSPTLMAMQALQQKQQAVVQSLDRNLGITADKNIGAGVLPITYIDGVKYVVLGQESAGAGWSLFGGAINPGEQPLSTAARECWEEMNAQITLGMTSNDMSNYVNSNNTKEIIALHHGDGRFYTCYLTEFNSDFMEVLRTIFRTQYSKITHKEMKDITFVAWDALERAIKGTTYDREKDKTYQVQTKNGNTITLRDIVVKVLRPYFKDPKHNHKYMKW